MSDGKAASETGQVFYEACGVDGLVCKNEDNTPDICDDYRVSYKCKGLYDEGDSAPPPNPKPDETMVKASSKMVFNGFNSVAEWTPTHTDALKGSIVSSTPKITSMQQVTDVVPSMNGRRLTQSATPPRAESRAEPPTPGRRALAASSALSVSFTITISAGIGPTEDEAALAVADVASDLMVRYSRNLYFVASIFEYTVEPVEIYIRKYSRASRNEPNFPVSP